MSKGDKFSYLVQENRLKIHWSFIMKSFFFPLSLIYFDYKIWKRNWIIFLKKNFWNWLVNMEFKSTFSLKNLMKKKKVKI
jgi:hypothetical protein